MDHLVLLNIKHYSLQRWGY